jgi:hypothetical protein
MKRLSLLIGILALLLLPMACVDQEQITQDVVDSVTENTIGNYTIKVGGTAGLRFTGEYQVNSYSYDLDTDSFESFPDWYSVEGEVPAKYTFEAMVAGGLFQKLTGYETLLTVEIWKDGVLQDSASTASPWGAVMVVGGP